MILKIIYLILSLVSNHFSDLGGKTVNINANQYHYDNKINNNTNSPELFAASPIDAPSNLREIPTIKIIMINNNGINILAIYINHFLNSYWRLT